MGFSTTPCNEFVTVLASKAPVPGGGGASALAGAVGTALGNMVGSLTVGKKKYADVEEEIIELKAKCDVLQQELLALIERDAEVFAPLAKAYGMPKDTEEEKAEKARVMAIVLKDACMVPMEIMEKCAEALESMKDYAEKGLWKNHQHSLHGVMVRRSDSTCLHGSQGRHCTADQGAQQ